MTKEESFHFEKGDFGLMKFMIEYELEKAVDELQNKFPDAPLIASFFKDRIIIKLYEFREVSDQKKWPLSTAR